MVITLHKCNVYRDQSVSTQTFIFWYKIRSENLTKFIFQKNCCWWVTPRRFRINWNFHTKKLSSIKDEKRRVRSEEAALAMQKYKNYSILFNYNIFSVKFFQESSNTISKIAFYCLKQNKELLMGVKFLWIKNVWKNFKFERFFVLFCFIAVCILFTFST